MGPFKVLKVKVGSVTAHIPPHGETEVSHQYLRSWPLEVDESDTEEDPTATEQVEVEERIPENSVVQEFEVENILGHKQLQGWKFLTKWRGSEVADTTWEPLSSFVWRDKGTLVVNKIFQDYCRENRLLSLIHQVENKV